MIRDYRISKPLGLGLYAVHRFVAELCGEDPFLFVDRGDYVEIRTRRELSSQFREIVIPTNGDVIAFSLRSAVSKRHKGKNTYARLGDWRARHEWLQKRSEKNGFTILALHATDGSVKVEGQGAKTFSMDRTDFTGVLKVCDQALFAHCLIHGIGRVGKPYGMGMLVI